MCGRYAFFSPSEAIAQLMDIEDAPEIEPRYNIAPSQYVPVVRLSREGQRRLGMLHWGLIPYWAKDKSIGYKMINARSETLTQKPAFREAFKRRRCLIPADGFYEWRTLAGKKVPFFVTMKNGQPFAMAGLWERWRESEDAEPLDSCTIITTQPNELVSELHDRMPAIVPPEHFGAWLDREVRDTEALGELIETYRSDAMRVAAASTLVNNPANEGPELLEQSDL